MVINGVRAAYRLTQTSDRMEFVAYVQYVPRGLWEIVGGPQVTFPDAASARQAIQSQIVADWSKG
ncbi:MAG: hypothetical protein ACRER5_24475, partial [Pseudomonas sp.]